MSGTAQRRIYDADEVDAYTAPLEAKILMLREQLEATGRATTGTAVDDARVASGPFLGRARQLAQMSADETIRAAQHEASAVLARANDEAQNRLADAQVRAAMLVSAAHGRIDSLAIGWEHQLVRQISDTGHGVLSGLDGYLEQLRNSPEDWQDAEDVADSGKVDDEEAPAISEQSGGDPPEAYLALERPADGPTLEPATSGDADRTAPGSPLSQPAANAPPPRRRGYGVFRFLKSFRLFRSRALRNERVTSGDDPFFNPDLRWKDSCPDEEFMSFLRDGGGTPQIDRSVPPVPRAMARRRGQHTRAN